MKKRLERFGEAEIVVEINGFGWNFGQFTPIVCDIDA